MITETMITNGIGMMKMYLPNLFEFISEKEFEQYLRKSYDHSEEHGGGTLYNNFLVFQLMVQCPIYSCNVLGCKL